MKSEINIIRLAVLSFLLFLSAHHLHGQDLLPPVNDWNGKSIELVAKANNPLITTAEKSNFKATSTYDETIQWFNKLISPLLKKIVIGKSANGRDIFMIIATQDKAFDPTSLRNSSKPLLFAQAGIHAGEIDGKDAGMMLLRDIAFGKKTELLNKVNFAFIPILNPDGHERSSPYNRANQHGPENMGWRANAKNLNLNRDYTKLETEEIRAVVQVINEYEPDLYLDLHVTDGADYQYDITYGFAEGSLYSPGISSWIASTLTPEVNAHLSKNGHIPGQLQFAYEGDTFLKGMSLDNFAPRFSHAYGDVRHLPSILVENHSLKPYRQRVLGTYIFLEGVLKVLGSKGVYLMNFTASDKKLRSDSLVLTYKTSSKKEMTKHLGIESKVEKSVITNADYVRWTGKKIELEIPVIRRDQPDKKVRVPKAYWIPATHPEIIQKLQLHGIIMQILDAPKEIELTMYRISNPEFDRRPSQGRFMVRGTVNKEIKKETFYPGSARVETNQDLGALIPFLLEPESSDSFFQWGYFHEIFDRIEYVEEYVLEPLVQNMLKDPKVKEEFERKKQEDEKFRNDVRAIYDWFYRRSPYNDSRFLLYPVGLEY